VAWLCAARWLWWRSYLLRHIKARRCGYAARASRIILFICLFCVFSACTCYRRLLLYRYRTTARRTKS